MQPLTKKRRLFWRQYLLAVGISAVPICFLSWQPIPLPWSESQTMPRTLFQLFSLVATLAVPLLVWYGGRLLPRENMEPPAAVLLIAGLLFTAGLLIPALTSSYQAAGRFVVASGLLAATLTVQPTRAVSPRGLLPMALLIATVLAAVLPFFPLTLPITTVLFGGSLPTPALFNVAAATCYTIVAFRARRLNARRRTVFFLQIGLFMAAGSALIFTTFLAVNKSVVLLAMIYEAGAYLLFGVSLLPWARQRPAMRVARLTVAVADYRERYDKAVRVAAGNRSMMRDVMQQVSTERSHRLMREMFDQVRAATVERATYQQTLQQIVALAAKSLDAQYLFLTLEEGKPPGLHSVMHQSTIPPEDLPWKYVFTRRVFAEEKTLLIEDLSRIAPLTSGENTYSGFRSLLSVPILLGGQALGVLELLSREANRFSSQDAVSLAMFAEHAAVVIRNVQVYTVGIRTAAEMQLFTDCLEVSRAETTPVAIMAGVGQLLSRALTAPAAAAYLVRTQPGSIQVQDVFSQSFSDADSQKVRRVFAGVAADRLTEDNRDRGLALLTEVIAAIKRPNGRKASVLPFYARGMMQGFFLYFLGVAADEVPYREDALRMVAVHTAMAVERAFLFESVREVGFTDALTGLANRRFFDFSLGREVGRARRYGRPLSLLLLDIDFFKHINDTYGHPAGDKILKKMGDLLRVLFRKTDLVARYGGEEFVVVLPETGIEAALQLAERFRHAVAQTLFVADNPYQSLTVSIGLATLRQDKAEGPATEADLVLAADQALYRAKEMGRDRVEM